MPIDPEILSDALDFLEDRLSEGIHHDIAVEETCEEYDVNSSLIRRKFEEKLGSKIESYVPRTNWHSVARKKAREEARHWAMSEKESYWLMKQEPGFFFNETPDERVKRRSSYELHELNGAIFQEGNQEFSFVDLGLDGRSWAVRSVRVDVGRARKSTEESVGDIMRLLIGAGRTFSSEAEAEDWVNERIVVGPKEEIR